MSKYIVINVGCIECGVSTEIVGVYKTEEQANQVASEQESWREGGQSCAEVFKLPKVSVESQKEKTND